jgi:hypothetical protein
MSQLLRFPTSVKRDPAVEAWMHEHSGELGSIAQRWFAVMRECGDDVRELLHDGHPTVCVADAAFAYVNAFKAHVNVGFFRGAELVDPECLLEGTGKFMRHVKLRPGSDVDATALTRLIETAYTDIKGRLDPEVPKRVLMRNLAPDITRQRLLIEGFYSSLVDRGSVEAYLTGIAARLNLRTYGTPVIHSAAGEGKPENAGFDAFIPLIDSGISLYVWTKRRFFASVLFTCKMFDVRNALEFTRNHFRASQLEHREF